MKLWLKKRPSLKRLTFLSRLSERLRTRKEQRRLQRRNKQTRKEENWRLIGLNKELRPLKMTLLYLKENLLKTILLLKIKKSWKGFKR